MLANLLKTTPQRVHLLEVAGRVDGDHAATLAQSIDEALAGGRNQIILDLGGVEFMNSAGLRALVQILKRVQRAGGALFIVNPSDYVMRLLELVGLESVLDIHFDAAWHPLRLSPDTLPPVQHQLYYFA